jgi:hypothetical protein
VARNGDDLGEAWISAAELAEVARSLEPLCTASTPRWLRRRRLLPTPTQIGGRYFYPSYAAELLRADTRWRQRGVRDVEARRFLLWVEGFPLPLADIRPLIEQVVAAWVASSQDWVSTMTTSSDSFDAADGAVTPDVIAAIEAAAIEIASMRSRSPLPEAMRKRRMSKREKEAAISFALFSLLNLASAAAERAESAAAVDRMMGLDRRRKNMKPVLLAEDPLAVARFANPDRLVSGTTADADEIEVARRYLQLGFTLGEAFVAVMALDLGPSVEQAWLMLRETPAQLIGPLSALGVASMAGAIHANRHDINVDWILDNLQLRTIVFELHQSFEKASERFAFRQGLPARQCVFLDERLALEASRKARSPAEFR